MKLRVDFDVPEEEVEVFVSAAVRNGFKRVEPRKTWNGHEKKEAVKYVIEKLVQHFNA